MVVLLAYTGGELCGPAQCMFLEDLQSFLGSMLPQRSDIGSSMAGKWFAVSRHGSSTGRLVYHAQKGLGLYGVMPLLLSLFIRWLNSPCWLCIIAGQLRRSRLRPCLASAPSVLG